MTDPHAWQSLANGEIYVKNIRDSLIAADPEGKAVYEANAAKYLDAIAKEDEAVKAAIATLPPERRKIITSHDAFGYLQKYGLHLAPIAGLSPDAEPTPAVLAELSELIETEGLTTVFSERLASPALADTLATDLGLRTDVLDPIEGLTDETADEDYLSLMRQNLAALQEANGC